MLQLAILNSYLSILAAVLYIIEQALEFIWLFFWIKHSHSIRFQAIPALVWNVRKVQPYYRYLHIYLYLLVGR